MSDSLAPDICACGKPLSRGNVDGLCRWCRGFQTKLASGKHYGRPRTAMEPICIDCGQPINRARAKRCESCYRRSIRSTPSRPAKTAARKSTEWGDLPPANDNARLLLCAERGCSNLREGGSYCRMCAGFHEKARLRNQTGQKSTGSKW